MATKETAQAVAAALGQAAFLRILFPLLTILGPAILGYWGLRGLLQRQTMLFGRWDSVRWKIPVTGSAAMLVGLGYLAGAGLLVAVMGPITLAMIGIW
jgi:hypothetical protein